MVERANITSQVFSDLQAALDRMQTLTKLLGEARETAQRRAYNLNNYSDRSGTLDLSAGGLIAQIDDCKGDVAKIRELQERRRVSIIEFEITDYNVRELERQIERAAYSVKQLIRQALDYTEKRGERELDRPIWTGIAVIVRATEAIQNYNKWNSEENRKRSSWSDRRNREECELVVSNTLSRLEEAVAKAVSNRRNGYFDHDSVFDVDAYRPASEPGYDFRFSRNWQSEYRATLQVAAVSREFVEGAPHTTALQESLANILECEAEMARALDDLQRATKGAVYNSESLSLLLQRATDDAGFAKVAKERSRQAHSNRYEYGYFYKLLTAALALRTARAESARLMQSAVAELKEMAGKSSYSLGVSGDVLRVGVYVIYCADIVLVRSGNNMNAIGKNAAFMERFKNMQKEVREQVAELTAYAREKMF